MLAGVATAVMLGYIGPVNGYLAQRSELRAEQAHLNVLLARKHSLSVQLRALERADVLEARARVLGMVKPGEQAFVLKHRDLYPPPAAAAPHDGGLWGGVTSRF